MAPDQLDQQVREAESAAYAHYGLASEERIVNLDAGFGRVDVRLSMFGPPGDQPPILLLHGIASVTVLAAPLLPYLKDRYVIAVDWPGHGLSGTSLVPVGSSLREHAVATIGSLLDELGLGEVDLVGHSLGAQFSLYAGLDLASRVRRLVLLGAPGAGLSGVRPVAVMKLLALPRVGALLLSLPMSDKAFESNNERMLGAGALAGLPPDLVRAARLLGARQANAAGIASYFRALIRRNSVRQGIAVPLGELGTLTQPTLFAWGDDDVFLSPTAAASSIVAVRDSHLIRVPDAGHAPWLQAPAAVGAAVADHLRTAPIAERARFL